jgi:branched-chain amino acid aminotransferase
MGMESKFIWKNGELVPFEQATLHFLTPALHYGAAVFEGIRSYNTPKGPAIFRLREHVERLFDSARVLGFREFPWSVDDLIKAHKDTVRANGFTDCYVRPLIYLDGGGWNLNVDSGKPSLMIAVWEWNNYLGDEALAKGCANISSFTRHHVNVSMTKAKIAGNMPIAFCKRIGRLGFRSHYA